MRVSKVCWISLETLTKESQPNEITVHLILDDAFIGTKRIFKNHQTFGILKWNPTVDSLN